MKVIIAELPATRLAAQTEVLDITSVHSSCGDSGC